MRKSNWFNLVAVLLLLAFFAQTVTSMVVKSPTVDEQAHLMRGYVYLELGEVPFKLGHPIVVSALNAVPVWALTDLALPEDAAGIDPHATDVDRGRSGATPAVFQGNRWGAFADRLIWQPGNDVELIFFLGRLVTVALGMLFAALTFRWACHLWGGWGGIVALALFVFDPTIVAHSCFTTDDIAVSFFYFAATYGLWRYLETDRPRDLLLAGVAFGLAQGAKFSALLLGPVFCAVVALWPFLRTVPAVDRPRWFLRHAAGLLAIFAVGGLVLWAGYRFEVRPLPGWSLPVPATAYFEDLIWESKYLSQEGYVFLCGETSATGWWYYFLVCFVLKSPVPAILLVGATLISLRRVGDRARLMALLMPAFLYFLSTLIVSLNIGYRFFLPVLPYLYVLAGRLEVLVRKRWRVLLGGALVWSAAVALWAHPHYLAYFNPLAGGPDNGWRYLVDSNIDWGQDLPALRDVVERHDLGRIKLSYFGTAHPSYYGLDFEPLPTWGPTPEQGSPFTRTYYPHHPAPGVYAISATHLQGVVLGPDQWDTYAWFRDREPFAKAGYSIFLYRVEPTGPPVDVALWGLQVDELAPETFSSFGSNDVRLRWFNGRTSLVIPAQPSWYVVVDEEGGNEMAEWGWEVPVSCATVDGRGCWLYPPDAEAHAGALDRVEELSAGAQAWHSAELVPALEGGSGAVSALALPVDVGGQVEFLGYAGRVLVGRPPIGEVLTAWRVTAPVEEPRTIFVHLLTEEGEVAAQWDGLDVPVEGWREGDVIVQAASFEVPNGLPSGRYWLQTGVYDPRTMERLPVMVEGVSIADRILLSPVEVPGR